MSRVTREQLNKIRRMGGVEQDYSIDAIRENIGVQAGSTSGNPDSHVLPRLGDHELKYEGDYENEEASDEDKNETSDDFSKGDKVQYDGHTYVVVVADAKADFVGIAPVGREHDVSSIDLVHAHQLSKAHEEDNAEYEEDNAEYEEDNAEYEEDNAEYEEDNAEYEEDEHHMEAKEVHETRKRRSDRGLGSLKSGVRKTKTKTKDDTPGHGYGRVDNEGGSPMYRKVDEAHGRQRDTKVTSSLSRREQKRNEKKLRSKERQQGKKQSTMHESKTPVSFTKDMKEALTKVGAKVEETTTTAVGPKGWEDIKRAVGSENLTKVLDNAYWREDKNHVYVIMKEQDEILQRLVKEAMHHHSDGHYPETYADASSHKQPVNVSSTYDTVNDTPEFKGEDEDHEMANDTEKVTVPANVLSDLKATITACEAESAKAEKRDDDPRKHYYAETAKALQMVHDYLGWKTVEGLKRAQLVSQRMANVSRALMPDHVWKFLVDGGKKRSLKDYHNEVKGYPIVGPRNTLDN